MHQCLFTSHYFHGNVRKDVAGRYMGYKNAEIARTYWRTVRKLKL